MLPHITSVSLMIHNCSPYIIITPWRTLGFITICLPNIILKQLLSIKTIHCHPGSDQHRYIRLPQWVYIAQLKEKQFDLLAVLSRKDVDLFNILSSSLPPLLHSHSSRVSKIKNQQIVLKFDKLVFWGEIKASMKSAIDFVTTILPFYDMNVWCVYIYIYFFRSIE